MRFAGGWLFDLVIAGWDVVVHVNDPHDTRPLRILGARAVDLQCTLASRTRDPHPQALAVDADLYDSDARVRRMVSAAAIETRLWAQSWPTEGPEVQHRLSVAALAFKAQALAAASASVEVVAATEVFRHRCATTRTGSARSAPRPRNGARQPAGIA